MSEAAMTKPFSPSNYREPLKILIVDDDAGMRFFLFEALQKEGYACETVTDGQEALAKLEAGHFQMVLMDIRMPRLSGLPALSEMKKRYPDLLVILITAYGSKKVALEAIGKGAYDYFTKPFDLNEMRIVLKRGAERCRLQEELEALRQQVEGLRPPMIGRSEPFRRVMDLIAKAAPTDITVLITGESGTGKELVARAIHDRSPRRSGPFVAVNCAAIPESLLEVELFGYEPGAFTGAEKLRLGKLELAQGGTIFFDEIGELALSIQTKILRVLQEREIERIGGSGPIPVDVRFIAATNRDPSKEVAAGNFRSDLFFRLNVFDIALPALRDRGEDIPALVDHFLKRYSVQLKSASGGQVTRISQGAMDLLLQHHWPGNIRELENIVQRAMILVKGDCLDEKLIRELLSVTQSPDLQANGSNLKASIERVSAQAEKRLVEEALREEQGRRAATARRLGISRKNLYNKMKRYGLI